LHAYDLFRKSAGVRSYFFIWFQTLVRDIPSSLAARDWFPPASPRNNDQDPLMPLLFFLDKPLDPTRKNCILEAL
jgi:hypothetical protein